MSLSKEWTIILKPLRVIYSWSKKDEPDRWIPRGTSDVKFMRYMMEDDITKQMMTDEAFKNQQVCSQLCTLILFLVNTYNFVTCVFYSVE